MISDLESNNSKTQYVHSETSSVFLASPLPSDAEDTWLTDILILVRVSSKLN